jgi:hypothetical protein
MAFVWDVAQHLRRQSSSSSLDFTYKHAVTHSYIINIAMFDVTDVRKSFSFPKTIGYILELIFQFIGYIWQVQVKVKFETFCIKCQYQISSNSIRLLQRTDRPTVRSSCYVYVLCTLCENRVIFGDIYFKSRNRI